MTRRRNGKRREEDVLPEDDLQVENYIPTPPDGGYGWVIVFASFFCNVIVDGIGYTFGIFLIEFIQAFNEPKSKIALVGSVQIGTYLCVGPIVSGLTNRFGCRKVCIVGSVLSFIAFCGAVVSPNVEILILTYGVVAGFGFGMMYLPAIVSVGFYFERRRALATGIAVAGSGVGTFILAPISNLLLNEYGWRGSLLILAGLVANGILFGALMRPLTPTIPSQKEMKERNGTNKKLSGAKIDKGENKIYKGNDVPPKSEGLTRESSVVFTSAPNITAFLNDGGSERVTVDSEDPETAALINFKVIDVEKSKEARMNSSPSEAHHMAFSHSDITRIKQDLSRPLYRKDIFYSGSVHNIPEFHQSKDDMRNYIKSVTSIASIMESEPGDTCFSRMTWLPKPIRDTLATMLNCSLLKNPSFLMIILGNAVAMLGYYVPFVYVADRALEIGIESSQASLLLSIIGIMNTVGRIVAGFIADFKCVNSLLLNNVAMLLCGIATILCPFCTSYVLLCIFATVFGLCVAAYISLTSIILCDLLGVENLTNAFGLLTLARGVSSIAGSPLAGAVYDATKSYNISFYMGGGLIIFGAVFHFLLHLPCFKKIDKDGDAVNVNSDVTQPLSQNNKERMNIADA